MPPFLTVSGLRKRFGEQTVLDGVSLEVEEGTIAVLLGPSGSGKTTLLRLIAGFETPDDGSIRIADEEITRLPPAKRNFGMVFQHYALFPHLSVGENVAFGLTSRGLGKTAIAGRVAEALELVDLGGFEARRVHEISGGQQQRVALARALAPQPRVLLLDEPLSNLDPALRERTREELREAIRRVGITAAWVTHEQEEAFGVGDRVALLNEGRIEQFDAPETLYLHPRSRFVARFVGRTSTLHGVWDGEGTVHVGDVRFLGWGVRWAAELAGEAQPGDEVDLLVRPEGLELVRPGTDGSLQGTVKAYRFAGETSLYRLELEMGGELEVAGPPGGAEEGDLAAAALRAGGPPPRAFPRERGA